MPKILGKNLSLIGGFLFGTIGALWSYFYVSDLNHATSSLSGKKAELVQRMEEINRGAYDYFIANQQADLMFALSAQPGARQDLIALLFKGNMLDRAGPVRNLIGALALAKVLDYRQTYDAYEKLNDAAREKLDFAAFTLLKESERDTVSKAQAQAAKFGEEIFALEGAMNVLEAQQRTQRAIGLVCSVLGNLLLLAANLKRAE